MENLKVYFYVGSMILSPLCWVAYNHPNTYSIYFQQPIYYICTSIFLYHLLISAFIKTLTFKFNDPKNHISKDQKVNAKTVSWAISQTEECRPNETIFLCSILFAILNIILSSFPEMFHLDADPKPGITAQEISTNYRLIDVQSDTRKYIVDSPSEMKKKIKDINMIQTSHNWRTKYLNNWIRVEGGAKIGSSWVSLEDHRGDITIIFDDKNVEEDMIWLSSFPDGIKITAEGKIVEALKGDSIYLWEGKLISVDE